MEQWKAIEGYNGKYEASTDGRIRNVDKGGYILQGARASVGYIIVGLYKNGRRRVHLVHRLIAETFIPNPENKAEVNHKNKNTADNRVENLEWVTRQENLIHRDNVRLSVWRKDSPEQYPIRELREQKGWTQETLARVSGVDLRNIQRYENRERDFRLASVSIAYRLAQALGVSIEFLACYASNENGKEEP